MIRFSRLFNPLRQDNAKSFVIVTKEIGCVKGEESPTDRQERVPGFEQRKVEKAKVFLIGAGGLGGEIAEGLIQKGLGRLEIFDGDVVGVSNLSRQKFFKNDLYKNKAICLAKFLRKRAVKKSEIVAHPFMFQRDMEQGMSIDCDVVVCAPDNDETRIYVAKLFYKKKIGVVFTGLSEDANTGYVFVQEQGKACFACAFPHAVSDERKPCPNTPAITDIDKAIAGHILFAVDTLLMPERKRNWNYRQIFLCGFAPDVARFLDRADDCELCKGI